jgi:MYXO-CTERM domain-containing protein
VTIPAGQSGSIQIVFTPSAVGGRSGKVTLGSNDPLTPSVNVDLTGTGTSPVIAVAPSSVDFLQVRITQSGSATVTVTNNGTGPLSLTSAVLGGADAGDFHLGALSFPVAIAAGRHVDLSLGFTPSAVGTRGATLTLGSDDPASTQVVVPLTGEGISPNLALTPTSIDFGGQLVGRASPARTFDIHNTGSASLNVTSVSVGGANPLPFHLSGSTTPFTIAAGGHHTVTIQVTPTMVGSLAATAIVATDDPAAPSATVTLAALGISRVLALSPASLDFGVLRLGGISTPQTVTLTNVGGDPLDLAALTFTGAGAGNFAATPTAAQTLAPGASTTVDVSFHPTTAGTSAGALAVVPLDVTVPQAQVSVTGFAIGAFVTADKASLDLGTVSVGGQSAVQIVELTNRTPEPVLISSIASDDPTFVVTATPGTIAANGKMTFSVLFRPVAAGTRTGHVTVRLAGSSTDEATVTVTGNGTVLTIEGDGGCAAAPGARRSWPVALLAVLALVVVQRRRRRQP